jgi:hypothetical protein
MIDGNDELSEVAKAYNKFTHKDSEGFVTELPNDSPSPSKNTNK